VLLDIEEDENKQRKELNFDQYFKQKAS